MKKIILGDAVIIRQHWEFRLNVIRFRSKNWRGEWGNKLKKCIIMQFLGPEKERKSVKRGSAETQRKD
jgi:hypothetical protein